MVHLKEIRLFTIIKLPEKFLSRTNIRRKLIQVSIKRALIHCLTLTTHLIVVGCWSDQNFIALAGDDRLLTISNEEGESIFQCSIKGEASLVQFSKLQLPDFKPITGDNCISLLINRKSLFLLSLANPDSPIVLSFQEKYGKIIDYTWLADGLILVGFANGYLNVVSTNPKDIGQEVSIVKAHPESLISFAYSKSTNRVSSCSDNV